MTVDDMNKTLLNRSLLTVAGMLAAGGTTAALAVADGHSDTAVLDQAEVRAKLAASGPSQAPTGTSRQPGKDTPLVSSAGTLIVGCHRNSVTSYRAIPKAGWTMTDARMEPVPAPPSPAATPSIDRSAPHPWPGDIVLIADFRHDAEGLYRQVVGCDGQEATAVAMVDPDRSPTSTAPGR